MIVSLNALSFPESSSIYLCYRLVTTSLKDMFFLTKNRNGTETLLKNRSAYSTVCFLPIPKRFVFTKKPQRSEEFRTLVLLKMRKSSVCRICKHHVYTIGWNVDYVTVLCGGEPASFETNQALNRNRSHKSTY